MSLCSKDLHHQHVSPTRAIRTPHAQTQTQWNVTTVHVTLGSLVTVTTVKMLTNVTTSHVTVMPRVPTQSEVSFVLVIPGTVVTEHIALMLMSVNKTITVMPMPRVRILMAVINVRVKMDSMVLVWTVQTSTNV